MNKTMEEIEPIAEQVVDAMLKANSRDIDLASSSTGTSP